MARACPRGSICIDLTLLVAAAALVMTFFVAFGSKRTPQMPRAPIETARASVDVQVNPTTQTQSIPLAPTFMLPINVPTQGYVADFQSIGTLTSANGDIMPLMGKPLIPGRSKWNYFTLADNYAQVKMPVVNGGKNCMEEYGCDELSSGDSVSASGAQGPMTVSLYPKEYPRYIPF